MIESNLNPSAPSLHPELAVTGAPTPSAAAFRTSLFSRQLGKGLTVKRYWLASFKTLEVQLRETNKKTRAVGFGFFLFLTQTNLKLDLLYFEMEGVSTM